MLKHSRSANNTITTWGRTFQAIDHIVNALQPKIKHGGFPDLRRFHPSVRGYPMLKPKTELQNICKVPIGN